MQKEYTDNVRRKKSKHPTPDKEAVTQLLDNACSLIELYQNRIDELTEQNDMLIKSVRDLLQTQVDESHVLVREYKTTVVSCRKCSNGFKLTNFELNDTPVYCPFCGFRAILSSGSSFKKNPPLTERKKIDADFVELANDEQFRRESEDMMEEFKYVDSETCQLVDSFNSLRNALNDWDI